MTENEKSENVILFFRSFVDETMKNFSFLK